MLLSLVFSVVLLGSMTASPGAVSTAVNLVVADLTKACIGGVKQTVVDEIRSEQNQRIAEFKTVQEQLTALQGQLTVVQEQLTALQPTEVCPGGWSHHDRNCYLIPPEKTNWHDAHAICTLLDRRARLASVHRESSQFIKAMVARRTSFVWIGLVRLAGDAGWIWTDGTPLDFTSWDQGQPDTWQNCVCITQAAELWHGCNCPDNYKILCQIKLG